MLSIRQSAAITFLLLMSAGCASVNEGVRVALKSELRLPNAAPSPELIEQHCPFGAPVKAPELDHGPTRLVGRDAYVLEHDTKSKIALWVCGSLDPDVVFGDAERRDRWRPEPDVPSPGRAIDDDYKGSGYQRGHMVASEDRVATQELNDETFFLSNAVPQNGSLNGGQWAQLEAAIRTWVENGTITNARMITGGFFYDPREDDANTADGLIDFKQIGANKVAVPTHVFKIVAGQTGNTWRAIGFVAENAKPKAGWNFAQGIKAIDWIEEQTGLNFMPDLDPQQEVALEAKPSPIWKQ